MRLFAVVGSSSLALARTAAGAWVLVIAGFTMMPGAAAQEVGALPGAGRFSVEPTTIIVGETDRLTVLGDGLQDCQGEFQLAARLADRWRKGVEGHVLGAATVSVGSDGRVEAELSIDPHFAGEWNGAMTLEGGCLQSTGDRLVFGELRLAFRTTSEDLAQAGIPQPAAAGQAAAFVVPSEHIQSLQLTPDRPPVAPEELFGHLSAWVGDVMCDRADVAAGEVTAGGDAVVWVGLPGQPAPCLAEGAAVTFRVGAEEFLLLNQEIAVHGLVSGFRPAYPGPDSGGSAMTGAESPEPQDLQSPAGLGTDHAGPGQPSPAAVSSPTSNTSWWPAVALGSGVFIAAAILAGAVWRRGAR